MADTVYFEAIERDTGKRLLILSTQIAAVREGGMAGAHIMLKNGKWFAIDNSYDGVCDLIKKNA